MNRINPLYILSALFVCLLISFLMVYYKQNSLLEQTHNHQLFTLKAKEYGQLKSNGMNKNRIIRTINMITSQRELKNANMSVNHSKHGIAISLESSDPGIIHRFVNRILNEKLLIVKWQLQPNKIDLEVGL